MSTQQVYFNDPSIISGIQTQLNGYSTSFTTNTLNVQTLQFADDNVLGNVNSKTGPLQWVTYTSTGAFVTCEDTYATNAALQCLQTGGNAFDAAVTAMAVLGLTIPTNAGIGGGGYAVMYHKDTNRIDCIDFRETAPLRIDPYCLSTVSTGGYGQYNGTAAAFNLVRSRQQGYAVGVPGTPAFMKEVLERYGTFNLGQCFYPAIQLATGGFLMSQSLNSILNQTNPSTALRNFTGSRVLYYDPAGGYASALPVGTVIKNPDYAATLQTIANTNTKSFYYGSIGQDIVNCVQNPPKIAAPSNSITGGNMTMEDLALYQVKTYAPIRVPFRDCFVFLPPPSTSGGLAIAQALGIYQALVPNPTGGFTGCADSLFARQMAIRYAWADRNAYAADPLYFPVPTNGLLDSGYLTYRASQTPASYNTFTSSANAAPFGSPTGFYAYSATGTISFTPGPLPDPTTSNGSTTPLVIGDEYGNVISITFTIEQLGGSGMTVPGRGFLLNNELTDFNQLQNTTDLPTANSPQGGKRPRSSMAPALVFRNGSPIAALSSAGGAAIPNAIFNAIVNIVDYNYTVENALLEGRYQDSNGTTVAVDANGTLQRFYTGSAYNLLTTYKGYPSTLSGGYFSFGATGAIPNTTMCIAKISSTGASCGLNWPSTQYYQANNYRYGNSNALRTISSSNTGSWSNPVINLYS